MRTRKVRKPHVVDTNVAVVANRRGGESYSCASACAQALLRIKISGLLIVDDSDRIFDEYRRNCSTRGQPGMGDSFVKWAHDHRWKQDLVQTVAITPHDDDSESFVEFPKHQDLAKFDPSDRKFVAVSCAHPERPPILQATDTKWWGWNEALAACGVTVEFLCPDEIEQAYRRKFGE
jgi:hypothetical protein